MRNRRKMKQTQDIASITTHGRHLMKIKSIKSLTAQAQNIASTATT